MTNEVGGEGSESRGQEDTRAMPHTVSLATEWAPGGSTHPNTGAAHLLGIPAVVLLMDYLFFQGEGGLSYTVALAVLPMLTIVAGIRAVRPVPVALFVLSFLAVALRCAWQCESPTILTAFVLVVTFPIALHLGKISLPDIVASLPATCVISAPLWFRDALVGLKRVRHSEKASWYRLPSSTVLIPLAVCAAFAVVFLLSNPILQEHVEDWYASLEGSLVNLLEFLAPDPRRPVFWFGCLFLAAILIRPVYKCLDDCAEWKADEVSEATNVEDGAFQHRTALNTLIAVNVLFLLYNAVDAYYLLIRDALPEGLNHSQYTHRGAFWLTVALAMATAVIGRIFYGELNFHAARQSLLRWTAVWMAQNFILALWVLMRIHMYVEYNGMTRMRIIGLAGTTLVIIGLGLVAYKALHRKSLIWLLKKEFGAFLAACLVLAVLPMDYLAWGYNTHNILNSDPPRTSVQLAVQPLSPEGLGRLTDLLDHPDPIIAEGVAALLGQWYFAEGQLYKDGGARLERWTDYQFGRAWCTRVLAQNEQRILALVPDRDWQARIDRLREHTAHWI